MVLSSSLSVLRGSGGSLGAEYAADVFKSSDVAAAGTTAIWTPAAGSRFRLLGWEMWADAASAAAAAGSVAVFFYDGATPMFEAFTLWLPAASAPVFGQRPQAGPVHYLTGFPSAAAGNALGLNLGAAFTAGFMHVNAWGVEEP